MSRKAAYGYDYDDVYDDYEDYEDYECYDDGYGENGEAAAVNEETTKVKPGLWRCSICTYDNDDSMTYCDICGVLRYPPSNTGKNMEQKTAPFKFDIPSPDDVVSNRLHSTKITPRGAPPGFAEKNAATTTQPSERQTNSSVAFKGKTISLEENNNSSGERQKYFNDTSTVLRNNDAVAGTSSSKRTHNIPTRNQKSKHDDVGEYSSLANGAKSESLSSSLDSMSLNSKSGASKPIVPKKTLAQYKPEKWMLLDKEGNVMTQLNLAIVGHVDSGKSTLSGRLLHLLGQISQKQMHKYEKESKQQGKGSFAYAWALDESAEERERGITMTVAVAYFDTKKYHVVVLDSPGHKDFVPNMISGATQADAAILVIDASVGAYETGMDVTGGQSREHAQLIRSFGVDQIIVAINKMDAVGYSKERFELIKRQVGSFLRQCGFKESFISWVPLSAMENQNLVTAASDDRLKSWYKGPHLLDAIDLLHPPRRDYEKPLAMPICDVIKTHSMGQVSASGKLEAGALRSGSKVLVMPLGEVATVRSIECNSQPCAVARAGDNVSVVLQGIDVGHVIAGGVLCHPDFPVKVASCLEIKILVLEAVKTPILIGSQLEFHIHHAKEAARVVKIVSLLDPKTGKETKKAPRCLLSKQSAIIEVALQAAVCVEEASTCKALGRVFLRSSGRTVAVGVVTRVIEDQA